MIYDYTVNNKPTMPSRNFIVNSSGRFKVQLAGVCSQIRCDVHAWLAEKWCCFIIVMPTERLVLPNVALRERAKTLDYGPAGWKGFNSNAPRNFKFWRVHVVLSIEFSGRLAASIDFRRRTVSVYGARVGLSHPAMSPASLKGGEALSPEAVRTSEESVTKVMQAMVEQEGFDGFTLKDMYLLLHKLKVSIPEPSGDFGLSFEVDPASVEKSSGLGVYEIALGRTRG
jgi:hypothetical protein